MASSNEGEEDEGNNSSLVPISLNILNIKVWNVSSVPPDPLLLVMTFVAKSPVKKGIDPEWIARKGPLA